MDKKVLNPRQATLDLRKGTNCALELPKLTLFFHVFFVESNLSANSRRYDNFDMLQQTLRPSLEGCHQKLKKVKSLLSLELLERHLNRTQIACNLVFSSLKLQVKSKTQFYASMQLSKYNRNAKVCD